MTYVTFVNAQIIPEFCFYILSQHGNVEAADYWTFSIIFRNSADKRRSEKINLPVKQRSITLIRKTFVTWRKNEIDEEEEIVSNYTDTRYSSSVAQDTRLDKTVSNHTGGQGKTDTHTSIMVQNPIWFPLHTEFTVVK